jgi:hypothetical protein
VAHRAHRLHDVQRKSTGDRDQQPAVRRAQRPTPDGFGEPRGVHVAQRPERKLRERPRRPQMRRPAGQFGLVPGPVGPQGRREQHGSVREEAETEGKKRQRLLVTPLHVVQHQQHRPPDAEQRTGQALIEAVTLPGID